MIKYILLFFGVIFTGITSVFAGVDTDAICADISKDGLIYQNIEVTYPTNEVFIDSIWKDYLSNGKAVLYYVVNVLSNTKKDPYTGKDTEKAEIYSYNCNTKKPKLLTSYPINANSEWYGIDQVIQNNIVLRRYESASDEGGAKEFSVYSTKVNKVLFTIQNKNNLFYHTRVTGFVDGKGAWYLYFDRPGYIYDQVALNLNGSAIFRIDKKTKKVTRL